MDRFDYARFFGFAADDRRDCPDLGFSADDFAVAAFFEVHRPDNLAVAARFSEEVATVPYSADQDFSDGTNVSSSAEIPAAISASSVREFLRRLNLRDITVDLSVVSPSHTYDANASFTNRKHDSMETVADHRVGEDAALSIVLSIIRNVARSFPINVCDQLKVDRVRGSVRNALGLIPFKFKHLRSVLLGPWEAYT